MSEASFEECEIREVPAIDTGFLGLGLGQARPSVFVAHRNGTIIFKSREFVARSSQVASPTENVAAIDEQVRRHREAAYQQVLDHLLADAWLPVGSNEEGKIVRLRRPVADKPGPQVDSAELLRHLTSLRDAGLLTQEEFEAKRAKL